jgi:hypothetical protein
MPEITSIIITIAKFSIGIPKNKTKTKSAKAKAHSGVGKNNLRTSLVRLNLTPQVIDINI